MVILKKKENIYKWKTDSGIQWREFGDKDIQVKYKGDIENWKSNGLGLNKISRWSKILFVKYANL